MFFRRRFPNVISILLVTGGLFVSLFIIRKVKLLYDSNQKYHRLESYKQYVSSNILLRNCYCARSIPRFDSCLDYVVFLEEEVNLDWCVFLLFSHHSQLLFIHCSFIITVLDSICVKAFFVPALTHYVSCGLLNHL